MNVIQNIWCSVGLLAAAYNVVISLANKSFISAIVNGVLLVAYFMLMISKKKVYVYCLYGVTLLSGIIAIFSMGWLIPSIITVVKLLITWFVFRDL